MKWEITTLGEISSKIQTGPFGSQLHQSDYRMYGTPVVMPKDLLNGRIQDSDIARVSHAHVNRLNRHKLKIGDIVYSRRGDIGRCAIVTKKEVGWLCGTGCLKISIRLDYADPYFIFYFLQKSEIIGWVINHAVGSTMLNLNTSILSKIPVLLPRLGTQKVIKNYLFCFDKLIENNQRQIMLLEEAAQRLYKEWFVDFKFPGHENTPIINGIPQGWKIEQVGNIIDNPIRRKQIKKADYLSVGSIPVIDQGRDFISGYTDNHDSLINLETPVIVFGDHTRILKYIQFPFAKGGDGTQAFVSKMKNMPQSLLFLSLKALDLSNYHYARHFKYLKEESILVPTDNIANKFDCCIKPVYLKINKIRDICKLLQESRDRLLPKLMRGEIEV